MIRILVSAFRSSVLLVAGLAAVFWCLLSEPIVCRMDRFFPLSDGYGAFYFLGPGIPQAAFAMALWICLYFLVAGSQSTPLRKGLSLFGPGLLLWLAWMSWGRVLFHADNLSQSLLLLCGVLWGWVLARNERFLNYWAVIVFHLLFLSVVALGATDSIWKHYLAEARILRWRGPWVNPNTFGTVCGIGVFWACLLLNRHGVAIRRRGARVVSPQRIALGGLTLLLLAACIGGVLGSQSRAALWGAWLILVLSFFKLRQPALIALVFASGLGLFVSHHLGALGIRQSGDGPLKRVVSLPGTADLSWVHRWKCWNAAAGIGFGHPLTGFGWSYPELMQEQKAVIGVTDVRSAMLNNFVQALASRGLPGVVGLVALVLFTLRPTSGGSRQPGEDLFLYGMFCFLVIQMTFNDIIFSLPLAPVFWLLVFRRAWLRAQTDAAGRRFIQST